MHVSVSSACALRLPLLSLVNFLVAAMPATATLASSGSSDPGGNASCSFSAGSFVIVNNIVPRVELDAPDLLSIPAAKAMAYQEGLFSVSVVDLEDWIGAEPFFLRQ
jgi:hypothetical protein